MSVIKILTLNSHSLIEENYQRKLECFVDAVIEEQPDIIALQEVNQSAAEKSAFDIRHYSLYEDSGVIKEDNHVLNTARLLEKAGHKYHFEWIPIKNGYDMFDEGIAVMSKSPIVETVSFYVSNIVDYSNWKTRKILGIRTKAFPKEWFFSVHYGWWDDDEEPFENQWKMTEDFLEKYRKIWLMGDFNNPAEISNEGYDLVERSGWYDTYKLAENKDEGITVGSVIDGWKDKLSCTEGMRIDQIWCSEKVPVKRSEVIFNGKNYPVVSDHYGVMIEV